MNTPKITALHIRTLDSDPQIRDVLRGDFSSNDLQVNVRRAREKTGILVDHSIYLVVVDLRLAGEMLRRASGRR